ncbi:MAG: TonB family protein [Candidatus Sulfotelmatobacter sp.]|jgi:protein TonB
MGYQALLFCPDEKTARTVTQVLGELDFTVIPCTEPFAAVKKLMGEHFDAVVVDCDNEQNATLLFKSARNATNNQSSLAVAVVEGQAGVAKAFRIGANLVLTKPINVEQAKGTLRVARGLLRKGEAAKPATPAASTVVKPEAPAPLPPKAAPQLVVPKPITARPAPIAPQVTAATASIPTQKPAMQPSVVASVPTEITGSSPEPFEATSEEVTAQPIAKPAAQTSAPKIASTISSPAKAEPRIEIAASQPASSLGLRGSAASAPAPAREPKPIVSTENQASTVIPKPESTVEAVRTDANSASSSSSQETAAPAPEFTFGGNLSSGAKSAGGGSKKALLAVAAVVLLAAGGYEAWLQWGRMHETTTAPARVAVQPVTPAAVPQTAPVAPPYDATSIASVPSTSSAPSSTAATQPAGSPTTASDTQATTGAENPQPHPKAAAGTDSSKTPVSVVAANKAAATSAMAQPIVIKNGHARTAAKTPEPTTDEAAPSLTGIPVAANGGPIPNLMSSASKAPTPVLQTMSISQGVSRGLLVKTVQPSYPASALRLHIEGPVELMATISKNGDITAVKILKGDESLARAAAQAVKQWKYKPYLLNGEPVEIQTQVTVNFKLPR